MSVPLPWDGNAFGRGRQSVPRLIGRSSLGRPESCENVGIPAVQAECEFKLIQGVACAAVEKPPGFTRITRTSRGTVGKRSVEHK
jgi:hypothetical protein